MNWLRTTVQPDVTAGDLLAIGIPLVLALLGWCYYVWLKRHAFAMWFTYISPDVPVTIGYRRQRRRKWVAPLGRSIVLMPVYHRTGGTVSWFRVSLGRRDYSLDQPDRLRLGWRPERLDIIKVVDVHVGGKRGEEHRYTKLANERDEGIDIKFDEPIQWYRREPIFIEVVIQCDVEWCGRISFYGDGGNFYRCSVSKRLCVTKDPDSFGAWWARADNPKQSVSRKATTNPEPSE